MRITDEEMTLLWSALGERERRGKPLDPTERTALDLRDARALLREQLLFCTPAMDGEGYCLTCEKIAKHLGVSDE